jgi:magnesium transporter
MSRKTENKQTLITLTLLKSNAETTPSDKLETYPDQVHEGEVLWIDAESPTKQEMKTLQDRFSLDSYSIEDVTQQNERPKIEDQGRYVFSVIHIPVVKGEEGKIIELFIFFEKTWIITIHSGDSELIHEVDSRVRARGLAPLTQTPTPDLLFYTFLDFAVDGYYPILDEVENKLEELDERATRMFQTRSRRMENVIAMMTTVREIRKRLMLLRRSLTPTRDMIGMIMRGAVPFVADSSLRSFRDVYDHSFQLLETIDNDRDRTSDVRDLYLSLLTASTDQIVKVLTIVATIFLPLELLAGIYGMNFTTGFFEPGSAYPIGFYVLIAAMVAISVGLLYSFRKRGWI